MPEPRPGNDQPSSSELTADISRGTSVTVWTVGHGQAAWEEFLELLRSYEIEIVVDVRSIPYVQYGTHFNQPELEARLSTAGLSYQYLGEHLGQRPEGDEFYDADGHTLYEVVASQRWFVKYLGQVEHLAGSQRVALVCVEERPWECHRYLLLGKVLVERGAEVWHIRRDGSVQTQGQVAQMTGEAQTSLLDEPPVWRSLKPMRGGHGKP